MNRPKNLSKAFGWCRKKGHGFIVHKDKGCSICKTEKDRKDNGLCLAKLGHGPGHMSTTYCSVRGPHKVHRCVYGSYDQVATWIGPVTKMKFTGHFDEPPSVEE